MQAINLTIPKTPGAENSTPITVPWRPRLRFRARPEENWVNIEQVMTCFSANGSDGFVLRDRAPHTSGDALEFDIRPSQFDAITLRFLVILEPEGNNTIREITIRLRYPFVYPMDGIEFTDYDLKLPRAQLLSSLVNTVLECQNRIVWIYGPNCSGKSTLLSNALDALKLRAGDRELVVVDLNSETLRHLPVHQFQRAVDLQILQACCPLDQGVKWEEKLRPEDDYHAGLAVDDLYHHLLEHKSDLQKKLLVISLDEIDRFASNPGEFTNAYTAIAFLVDRVLKRCLLGHGIPFVLILVDWNSDYSNRCRVIESLTQEKRNPSPIAPSEDSNPDPKSSDSSDHNRLNPIVTFLVSNLDSSEVQSAAEDIFDGLGIPDKEIKRLAEEIYQQTIGNPLLVNALLEFAFDQPTNPDDSFAIDLDLAVDYSRVTMASRHMVSRFISGDQEIPRLSSQELKVLDNLIQGQEPLSSEKEVVESLIQRGIVAKTELGVSISIPVLRKRLEKGI